MAADDHFDLFGLPRRYDLDAQALEDAWRVVAARVHPDRYATASAAERRVAMQWAARANEAYRQLRDPMLRARYMVESAGVDLQTESNTAMAPAFLMQQMEWREMLDDARHDDKARVALERELQEARAGMRDELTGLIDQRQDFVAAGQKVREWMFIEKLVQELDAVQP